jgi:hypothetical protein
MKLSKFWSLTLIGIIFQLFLVDNCFAEFKLTHAANEESVRNFLQAWDADKSTNYLISLQDLNVDGQSEAIVYVLGRNWCGSGGCTTLILTQDKNTWQILTKITVTRLPIRVLSSVSHGWHDIGVWVQGGNVKIGYEAELMFDGQSYPRNPTVSPARMEKEQVEGNKVLSLPTP